MLTIILTAILITFAYSGWRGAPWVPTRKNDVVRFLKVRKATCNFSKPYGKLVKNGKASNSRPKRKASRGAAFPFKTPCLFAAGHHIPPFFKKIIPYISHAEDIGKLKFVFFRNSYKI